MKRTHRLCILSTRAELHSQKKFVFNFCHPFPANLCSTYMYQGLNRSLYFVLFEEIVHFCERCGRTMSQTLRPTTIEFELDLISHECNLTKAWGKSHMQHIRNIRREILSDICMQHVSPTFRCGCFTSLVTASLYPGSEEWVLVHVLRDMTIWRKYQLRLAP